MIKSTFLKTAIHAAREAEKILLYHFKKGVTAEFKLDHSPVTIADKEAEETIIEILKKQFPDHSFLGEESGKSDIDSEYAWIIDPLDMTKNFTRGIPLFSTEIALKKGEELIIGVSNHPALQEIVYAERGKGAYLNDLPLRVSSTEDLEKAYMSYGNLIYFQRKNMLEGFSQLVEKTFANRGFGDCWSYNLLAQGKIDLMVEAKVNIWDVAACALIVEEAGGNVTDINGKSITNQQTFSILATNGKLHKKVLDYFENA